MGCRARGCEARILATMAPLVIRNHVIVGVSGDFNDLHGFIHSFDPETGKLQWRWNALPQRASRVPRHGPATATRFNTAEG